ncbi:hypothetical protein [Pyxidicoccus caerfyrddinensis]|uniref:hypothetical protein n=1 Tax=Pyxidicoccus caerfyrddinensis TaxID=2709663 RepID=UPI0013DB6318|nr:hypothetical protein [Pyxidicoccus caerfyrddinensis]
MMIPQAVRDAAPAGAQPALRASTKYMETFQLVRPFSSGTELQTFLNAEGALDLYSVGTGDAVYRLRRGDAAKAPYSETALGITARQLSLFVPDGGSPDTPHILGVDSEGRLTLSRYEQATDAYFQAVNQPKDAHERVRRFLAVRGVTGTVYANVILEDGRLGTNFLEPGWTRWGGPVWAPVKGPDGKDARVKDITQVANNPVQSALFAIGENDRVLFAEDSFRTSQLHELGPLLVSTLSVVTDAEDLLNVFAVERDTGRLWLKKQRKYSTGGIQFDDWVRVDASQDTKLSRIFATPRFDSLLEVFGVSEDGRLHHTAQRTDSRGRLAGWAPLFSLGNSVGNALFSVGQSASGYSEAYTVTRGGDLLRFWQAPGTSQWFEEPVEVPHVSETMAKVPTHALELTVLSRKGVPMANAPVTLHTSFLTTLWVDGLAYRCSQVEKVQVRAGTDGRIVIHQRANALAAATLFVETPTTLAGSPLRVEPNGQLQQKLAGLKADDVLKAKDRSGKYLLPPEYRKPEYARSLAELSQASMKIAQTDGGARAVSYAFVARHAAAAGFRPQLDLRALGEQAWEVDFTSGFPMYRTTSVAEARSWAAAKATGPEALGGLFSVDWGSMWKAFKNGVSWVVDNIKRIVVTVIDGIGKVLFEIGNRIFEAVIEFAQQAFDFVEGVWNWLKVKLEQLYEWLAFLFDFDDIRRTAKVVRHTIDTVLGVTVAGIQHVRGAVAEGFDTLKNDLKQVVDRTVSILQADGNPSTGSYFSRNRPSEDEEHATDHNLLLNAFQQSSDDPASRSAMGLALRSPAVSSSLEALMEEFHKLSQNFEFGDGKQAWNEGVGYFTNIGNEPDRALELLLSGVIKVMESIALFALDAARGVVLSLFDLLADVVQAFREAITEKWEIPVVSQLYKLFTGDTLSFQPVDLVAYLVAIPTTLLYKVLLDKTPIPDNATLDLFRKSFSVEWLKGKLGLPSSGEAPLAAADPGWEKLLRDFCLATYAATMFVRIAPDGLLITLHAAGKGDPTKGLVSVLLRYVTTLCSMPWALNPATPAPEFCPGQAGFPGFIWLLQLGLGPTRGLLLLLMRAGKLKIYTGEVSISLWGAANIIMTSWHYAALPADKRDPLAFARTLTNIIPGQALRFLATPDMNKALKFIPAGGLAVVMILGYLGSSGTAIATLRSGAASAGPDVLPALAASGA